MKSLLLNDTNREEYLRKVYASWLGKIIGVRLGAPVENFSYEEILEKYSYFEVYYHSRSGITVLPDADFWKDYGITGVTEKDLKKMEQVVADAKKKVKSSVKNYDENGEKAARD